MKAKMTKTNYMTLSKQFSGPLGHFARDSIVKYH